MLKYLLISLIFISQLSYSQSLDSIQELREIVVAYKADQLSPISFQDLTDSIIASQPSFQEVSFLLASTPSITNYSDNGSYQGYSYFRMRGIDQTRVNMTLNGVPLNEPEDQGAYLANYPDLLNSIQNIQIQRGVSVSKNGAASYVGSVQLFSPSLYNQPDLSVTVGGGSYGTAAISAEYLSGLKGKTSLYARGSRIHSEGYKDHSSNDSRSLFLSGGILLDKSSLKFNLVTAQHSNGQAWLGVSNDNMNVDRRTNGNSLAETDNFTTFLGQIQHDWALSETSSLQSSVYYTRLDGNYNFDLGNYLGDPTITDIYNYAFLSNQYGAFSNYNIVANSFDLTLGVYGSIYNRQHLGSEKTYGTLYTNTGFKNEGSLFAKVNYSVGTAINLFGDLQQRWVSFDYTGSVPLNTLSWNFLNPKAGVSVEIGANSLLYYSIGSIGREPTRNDMFGGSDDLLSDSLGNALLFITESERVVDQELGYRFNSSNLSISANLYYMDFQNEIVLDGKFGPNGLALTNAVDNSIRTGIELSATYRLGSITLTNNSSYNYSRVDDQEVSFTPILTPPILINQEVMYSGKGFMVAVSGRYQDGSYLNYANTLQLEDYFSFNLRASTTIVKDFTLSMFLNNFTNADYYNSGYEDFDGSSKYFVAAPINIYISLKYKI